MRGSSLYRHPQQRQAPGGLAATKGLRPPLSLASPGRRTNGKLPLHISVPHAHTSLVCKAPSDSLCLLPALRLPAGSAVLPGMY